MSERERERERQSERESERETFKHIFNHQEKKLSVIFDAWFHGIKQSEQVFFCFTKHVHSNLIH